MNYRTIDDMNKAILGRLPIFPRDINLIVGIPRSGMFPANLLALYLNCRVTDLGSFVNGHIYQAGERGQYIDAREFKKVLVVDDSIASGAAMAQCKEALKDFEGRYDIKIVQYMLCRKRSTWWIIMSRWYLRRGISSGI